jgi:hypothetical protein
LWMILSFLQPLAWTLYFPNLNLCTSFWHYVYLQNWTFVLPCTWFIIFLALTWKMYFQKLNDCSHSFVLPCTWFYYFSSTSCESCTSETEHFYTSRYYCIYFPLA